MTIVYAKGIVTITATTDDEKHVLDFIFSNSDGMTPLISRYMDSKAKELADTNQVILTDLVNGNPIADIIAVIQAAKTAGTLK